MNLLLITKYFQINYRLYVGHMFYMKIYIEIQKLNLSITYSETNAYIYLLNMNKEFASKLCFTAM